MTFEVCSVAAGNVLVIRIAVEVLRALIAEYCASVDLDASLS